MTKLDYGGYEADPDDYPDGWSKLATIAEYLEDAEIPPPHLARWLGEAIQRSNKDQKQLLILLGLANARGGQNKNNKDAWLIYGQMVDDLVDEGMPTEQAISKVLLATGDNFSRSQLQRWYMVYKNALEAYHKIE